MRVCAGTNFGGPSRRACSHPVGVTIKEFEGGLYAVMTLEKASLDPFAIIPPGWKALHEWVITHPSYRGGNQQWLEEKISHPDGDDLILYYPLAPVEG